MPSSHLFSENEEQKGDTLDESGRAMLILAACRIVAFSAAHGQNRPLQVRTESEII